MKHKRAIITTLVLIPLLLWACWHMYKEKPEANETASFHIALNSITPSHNNSIRLNITVDQAHLLSKELTQIRTIDAEAKRKSPLLTLPGHVMADSQPSFYLISKNHKGHTTFQAELSNTAPFTINYYQSTDNFITDTINRILDKPPAITTRIFSIEPYLTENQKLMIRQFLSGDLKPSP